MGKQFGPQKGNRQQYRNNRMVGPVSQPSKVMLKIGLNRFKPQAEKIIIEKQAGFRAGRNTTEQIFNLRILCEKYIRHQHDLYRVFIDFKKAYSMVSHAALVSNYEEVQHQRQPYPSHQKPL